MGLTIQTSTQVFYSGHRTRQPQKRRRLTKGDRRTAMHCGFEVQATQPLEMPNLVSNFTTRVANSLQNQNTLHITYITQEVANISQSGVIYYITKEACLFTALFVQIKELQRVQKKSLLNVTTAIGCLSIHNLFLLTIVQTNTLVWYGP